MCKITETEKEKCITNFQKEIENLEPISFEQNTKWKENFPKAAGVYFGYLEGELSYIGETAELYSRMNDLRNTYNHTLRKKLGKIKLALELENNKFSEQDESKLNNYMETNLTIKALAVNFGRKEIEDVLVEKYKTTLLNSVSLRGKK